MVKATAIPTMSPTTQNEKGLQWVLKHTDKASKVHKIMLRDGMIDVKKLLVAADITNKRKNSICSAVGRGAHGAHKKEASCLSSLLLFCIHHG